MRLIASRGNVRELSVQAIEDWLNQPAFQIFPNTTEISNRAKSLRGRLNVLLFHATRWDWRSGRERFEVGWPTLAGEISEWIRAESTCLGLGQHAEVTPNAPRTVLTLGCSAATTRPRLEYTKEIAEEHGAQVVIATAKRTTNPLEWSAADLAKAAVGTTEFSMTSQFIEQIWPIASAPILVPRTHRGAIRWEYAVNGYSINLIEFEKSERGSRPSSYDVILASLSDYVSVFRTSIVTSAPYVQATVFDALRAVIALPHARAAIELDVVGSAPSASRVSDEGGIPTAILLQELRSAALAADRLLLRLSPMGLV